MEQEARNQERSIEFQVEMDEDLNESLQWTPEDDEAERKEKIRKRKLAETLKLFSTGHASRVVPMEHDNTDGISQRMDEDLRWAMAEER